uniref:Uncharacterized protein n=1 Tax=Ditylenchus dipsaci TaxID=166011 RepID=A0A915ECP2_9BILA
MAQKKNTPKTASDPRSASNRFTSANQGIVSNRKSFRFYACTTAIILASYGISLMLAQSTTCTAGVSTGQLCVNGTCAAGQVCQTSNNACCTPASRCARTSLAQRQLARRAMQRLRARIAERIAQRQAAREARIAAAAAANTK